MEPTGIAAVGTALVTLRSVVGLARDVGKIELQDKIFELQGQLIEIQSRMADLQDQNLQLRDANRHLREEIASMQKTQHIQLSLRFEAGLYWQLYSDGSEKWLVGPFCPYCWDKDQQLIRPRASSVAAASAIDFYQRQDATGYFYCDVQKVEYVVRRSDLSLPAREQ
jgi:hypothetical protein